MICLQKGNSHGNGEHPVTQIGELYMQKREETEVVATRQGQKLGNLLKNLQIKREQIEENYQEVKKVLDSIYDRSMKNLNRLYQEKAVLIRSDEIELKMLS